ncbi:MAG: hypothetical protein Q8O67_25830 [Deltaproteobacteria bacterium]|nr:hypothetical protein [Deltaproteobacteria bacterium]
MIEFATLVNNAWAVSRAFEIEDRVEVSIASLFKSHGPLAFLAAVLLPKERFVRIEVSVEDQLTLEQSCVPIVGAVALGKFAAVAGVAAIGKAELLGRDEVGFRYRLTTSDVRIHSTKVYALTTDGLPTLIAAEKQAISDKYSDTMDAILADL